MIDNPVITVNSKTFDVVFYLCCDYKVNYCIYEVIFELIHTCVHDASVVGVEQATFKLCMRVVKYTPKRQVQFQRYISPFWLWYRHNNYDEIEEQLMP